MDKELLSKLKACFRSKRVIEYKSGENIYRPADIISDVAFVKSGYVRLYSVTEDGEETTINLFKPIFPLSLYYSVNKKENPYYFEAITDVKLWKLSLEEFDECVSKDHAFKDGLIKYYLSLFEILLKNVEQSVSGNAKTKVAAIISSLANRHGHEVGDRKMIIDFAVPHRIISSLCGLTRETTSKMIKELQEEGLVGKEKGKIVVYDTDRLKEISHQ